MNGPAICAIDAESQCFVALGDGDARLHLTRVEVVTVDLPEKMRKLKPQ
jgi:hypothetical protein